MERHAYWAEPRRYGLLLLFLMSAGDIYSAYVLTIHANTLRLAGCLDLIYASYFMVAMGWVSVYRNTPQLSKLSVS